MKPKYRQWRCEIKNADREEQTIEVDSEERTKDANGDDIAERKS